MSDEGFLRRWSRRKLETRLGHEPGPEPVADALVEPEPEPEPEPAPAACPADEAPARADVDAGEGAHADAPMPARAREADAVPARPLPTMDDVATLTRDSDFSGFVARGVDQAVRRSALRKLFADPHFNTMDRLDIYIDDYTKPSPVSEAMLASLRHAARLFAPVVDEAPAGAAPAALPLHAGPAADAAGPQEPAQAADSAADNPSDTVSDTVIEPPPETETR